MLVYGVFMVRNEVDIIRTNVLHHLSLGVDRMLIVDNGSSDGTDRVLKELSKQDPRVRWSRDEGPYLQSVIITGLAREAFRSGADWVVPVDADEFWCSPRSSFRRVLGESEAGSLGARIINFVQRRSQRRSTPGALAHMTRRVASPLGPPDKAQGLVESERIGFVEKAYPPKWISRPSEEIEIEKGNHRIFGINGPQEETDEILCLHAPLRSRETLEARVRSADRVEGLGLRPGQSRNRRRWGKLKGKRAIELEWAANSYKDDHLDVYGERHPVIFDPMLRDLVAPWIPQPLWKRLLRSLAKPGKV